VHDPRIVTIYDWGEEQGAVYVAMELVDGSSLAETIEAGQRLGIDQAISIGIGVAQALDAAHRAGLAHGSLTPRDVLLARDGSVKVTDFGTATAGLASLGDQTEQAAYQSPEQLQGGQPDGRSDLYALGGILYLAATGAPPFRGADVVSLTQRKLAEPAVPPSAVTPGIPPGFDAVVERLLERDPARRYPSASDTTTELRRLQETIQVPLTAAPITATGTTVAPVAAAPMPPPPPEKKKSATGWIVAAIVILALAIGGVVAWIVLQDDDSAEGDTIVPAVVGLTLERAQADLQAAGLDASTVNENNEDFGPGIVFSQAPQPTTSVRRGSVVVLKVSAGPTTTTSSSTTSSSTTSSTTTSTTTTSTTTTTTAPPPPPSS
jgi:serine/threonine-protein kinase